MATAISDLTQAARAFQDWFREQEPHLSSVGTAHIQRIRTEAMARFAELGLPTTKHEEWKYTSLRPLAKLSLKPARPEANGVGPDDVAKHLFAGLNCHRLLFVNGRLSSRFSPPVDLPESVSVCSLTEAYDKDPGLIEAHLARFASHEDHAFAALNTAFLADGALVCITGGHVLDQPVHLIHVSVPSDGPTVSHPRNLIIVGDNCQATIIESYITTKDEAYLTNALTEIVIGENAVVQHIKLQEESTEAFHISMIRSSQGRSSSFTSHVISHGSSLARSDIQSRLDGEGAECTLNGLYMLTGRQHFDTRTVLDHAQPHCNSRELYKGILDGQSHGVFNGKIIVRPDAQKTDAKQSNMNILLAKGATVNSKPQLEIFADDVRCTHGATIGRLDDNALFYLRSRGIDQESARNLLIYGFASDVLGLITTEAVRRYAQELLLSRLPGGKIMREIHETR